MKELTMAVMARLSACNVHMHTMGPEAADGFKEAIGFCDFFTNLLSEELVTDSLNPTSRMQAERFVSAVETRLGL